MKLKDGRSFRWTLNFGAARWGRWSFKADDGNMLIAWNPNMTQFLHTPLPFVVPPDARGREELEPLILVLCYMLKYRAQEELD